MVLEPLAVALAQSVSDKSTGFPPSDMSDSRQAAVLILISDAASPDVTLIERSALLREHAGQIAFPGGAVEKGDASPIATALRETTEEIGLPASYVRVIGQLQPAWLAVTSFLVTPVVGEWDGAFPVRAVQAEEVAAVHRIPVADLVDPAVRAMCRYPGSRSAGLAFDLGEVFIWGITARLLSSVLELGGWAVPWDSSRILEVPRRFRRTIS